MWLVRPNISLWSGNTQVLPKTKEMFANFVSKKDHGDLLLGLATFFWDREGVLLVDFLERGSTINCERYCETMKKLRRAIQNKRRGKLSSKVLFFMTTPARTRPIALESSWIILDGRYLIIRRTVRILRLATTTCFQTWRPGSQRSTSTTTRNCRQAWMSGWSLRQQNSMTMELISLCTAMVSASIWTATTCMLKNSLRLWLSNVYNKKCFLSLGFFYSKT